MADQRIVRCASCATAFWTTEMKDPQGADVWQCNECAKLGYFDRNLLKALNRIGDELFVLAENTKPKVYR